MSIRTPASHPNFLTRWAEDKVSGHVRKSANCRVNAISHSMYEVVGVGHMHAVVNLADKCCSCRKFDLSQIACMHVAAVARSMGLTSCDPWVHRYYTNATLCLVY